MGLIYYVTNKVIKQRKLIEELENKDREHGDRLLNIEKKFKNVKTSTNDLIAKL